MSEYDKNLVVYLVTVALVAIGVIVYVNFTDARSLDAGAIEIYQMENGVTCYTFNTSIDCLQVGE
jgi:hypothetical protein